MLPIGDDAGQLERRTYVTWALVAVMAAILSYQIRLSPADADRFVGSFGLVPTRLFHDPAAAWPTLFTHVFLHGGLLHLAGNAVFLVVFGRRLEAELGSLAFLALFVVGGVSAGLASVLSRPDSGVPGIGASGAISAVMGAYLVLYATGTIRILVLHPLTLLWLILDQDLLTFGVPVLVVIPVWFGMQIVEGLAAVGSPSGVDYSAHVGGLLAGLLIVQTLRFAFGLWPDAGSAGGAAGSAAKSGIKSDPRKFCLGAARPLAAGHVLEQTDLQVQARRHWVGQDEGPISPAELAAVVGCRLRVDLLRYDLVRWADLETPAEQLPGSRPSALPTQPPGA